MTRHKVEAYSPGTLSKIISGGEARAELAEISLSEPAHGKLRIVSFLVVRWAKGSITEKATEWTWCSVRMKSNQASVNAPEGRMKIERPYSYRALLQEMLSELDRLLFAYPESVPHREVTRWLYDSAYSDLCRHCRALAAQELESRLEAHGRRVLVPEASPLLRPRITDDDSAGCTCCWLASEDWAKLEAATGLYRGEFGL